MAVGPLESAAADDDGRTEKGNFPVSTRVLFRADMHHSYALRLVPQARWPKGFRPTTIRTARTPNWDSPLSSPARVATTDGRDRTHAKAERYVRCGSGLKQRLGRPQGLRVGPRICVASASTVRTVPYSDRVVASALAGGSVCSYTPTALSARADSRNGDSADLVSSKAVDLEQKKTRKDSISTVPPQSHSDSSNLLA